MHAMVDVDRGQPRQGERQSQLPNSLTGRLGNAMPASQKPKRKKVRANLRPPYMSSRLSMAARNLINMVAVTAVSGATLLSLFAARHF
jgi:hypothetical protein